MHYGLKDDLIHFGRQLLGFCAAFAFMLAVPIMAYNWGVTAAFVFTIVVFFIACGLPRRLGCRRRKLR